MSTAPKQAAPAPESEGLTITALEVHDFKRVRAVKLNVAGESLVRIRGYNGEGKSSTLDAIAAAFGGAALCPDVPIRRGEKAARVVVTLDGGLVVERRWTEKTSTLVVRNADGFRPEKPQAFLDRLVGKIAFDPLAFLRLSAKDQTEQVRKLVGLDFTAQDAQRSALYAERTVVNREVAAKKGQVAGLPELADVPDAPVSVADLMAEQERRLAIDAANAGQRKNLETLRAAYRAAERRVVEVQDFGARQIAEADERVRQLEAQLAQARSNAEGVRRTAAAQEEEARAAVAKAKADGEAAAAACAALQNPDLEEIRRQIRDVEATNAKVAQKAERTRRAAELASVEAKSKALTEQIDAIDAAKAQALAAAPFPVPGLGFDAEGGLTLDGLPFAQASSAQQLRVSVAMGIALNPRLKIQLIKDGSLLDDRSLALVAQMARDAHHQVFIEQVGKDGGGIVIEDGMVEGAEAPVAEVAHA